ncbi:DUF7563 family protein [Natranaeroarchaeum sulfidigenes]
MPECDNCGAHLTPEYVRVFGDSSGSVPICIHCAPNTEARDAIADNE